VNNTGIAYYQSLKIEKKYKSGEYMSGYPKIYSLCDAFAGYPAITPEELKALAVDDYSRRVDDFEKYVCRQENTDALNLSNQALNYNPDYCPIDDSLAVLLSVIVDTDNVVTDRVTAVFSIYGKQFNLPQITAAGNQIVCMTNDVSGDFTFAGWVNASEPNTVLSSLKIYKFQIRENTTLIAKWTKGNTIQLVLLAGDNISAVTGAGNYLYNTLVTVEAELHDGALFSGWYKNGLLVSAAQRYQFNILEYTELEARASTDGDEYVLTVSPDSLFIAGQGGLFRTGLTSLKNGLFTACATSDDSDWLDVSLAVPNGLNISAARNDTGIARNAIITVTQSESQKKAYISVQQQAVAPDDKYEWVLNDSELTAKIEYVPSRGSGGNLYGTDFFFDHLENWIPSDPTAVIPSEPCTYDDYISGRKLNYKSYTVTIFWHGKRGSVERSQTVTVNIWFEAKIKS
jgi:hypothetical protein